MTGPTTPKGDDVSHQPPTDPPHIPGPPEPSYNPLGGDSPATRTPKRRKPWPWIIGGVVALGLLCCGGIGVAAALGGDPETKPGIGEVAADTKPTTPKVTTAPPPTTARYATPKPADFKLVVKTLKKECFGSAGCLVTYRVDPTYVGDSELDPDKTYRVTYEVRGVEDGPAVNNFELTGDTASMEAEELAQTPSTKAKLTAKATEVIEE